MAGCAGESASGAVDAVCKSRTGNGYSRGLCQTYRCGREALLESASGREACGGEYVDEVWNEIWTAAKLPFCLFWEGYVCPDAAHVYVLHLPGFEHYDYHFADWVGRRERLIPLGYKETF